MLSIIPALLVLEDKSVYKGWSLNEPGLVAMGEIVFNTGMTGYQEVLTDPSYTGQIITFSYPELGNTGINLEDFESSYPHVRGVIVKNLCTIPSNFRATQTLLEYFQKNNIVVIYGIDTRRLIKNLRQAGSMNGYISTDLFKLNDLLSPLKTIPSMQGLNLVQEVTTSFNYSWKGNQYYDWLQKNVKSYQMRRKHYKIIVIDFGVKRNILRRLSNYGCSIIVLSATATVQEILSFKPDGIFLSNGPGDPASVMNGIVTVKNLLSMNIAIPIFGICMGHQILSLALGAKTFKLKFGHHGLNHPAGLVKRTEVTSQNHGFAVDSKTLPPNLIKITHLNLNDFTVAGICHRYQPYFSVQYHPEAGPGPHDAEYLFDHFVKLIRIFKKNLATTIKKL
uniref:carbamoyl-phosphate synthase arginine-specific small subunit n=1 Tax=Glaucosphaera vacuolata TaxID=38265 RepID=UPI001FCCCA17|nr:carbamoyl-phosphate synthase arginine-specific small subunit [Glaucosphaera vacuolata]UNJ18630.1 carbamoyl-phosphate synthase arginine-specific small subunit [Glaucosphaera vacuolata]